MDSRSPILRRAAAASAGCLILSQAAAAQQPGVSAGRLAPPDEAARATFEKALLEVENVTPTRAEPLLQELLQARPDHGLLRALHAFSDPNMLTAERLGEMNRAVEDAAWAAPRSWCSPPPCASASQRAQRRP